MTTAQIWNNIVAWALQIGVLVALGALAPPLPKLRTPRARLLFWQTLLAACIVLPWIQPWRQEVVNVSSITTLAAIDSAATASPSVASAGGPSYPNAIASAVHRPVPFVAIVLCLLAAGIVVRLAWLAIGLARLAGYRRRGEQLVSDPVFRIATAISARWLVSNEISGPVTFGWRDPVVLLPARFRALQPELREAILCHELIHVERRDWLLTVAEEIIRAVFWFHPAVWWVLGEIQLAREQTVDEAVVGITHARGHYVDALLAMAETEPESSLDLAPAPLFLRRRHLKRRVVGLLQEVRMVPLSKVRLVLTQSAIMAVIAGACWVASGAFPLAAAPQLVADAAGVVVNTGDAKLLYRTPVAYPPEARDKGVQGRVVVEAILDARGEVSDETVVRCLPELCDAAVDSLPNWQFDTRQANTTRTISIDFVRPAGPPALIDSGATQLYAQVAMPSAAGSSGGRGRLGVPPPMTTATSLPSAPTFSSRTVWFNGAYVSLVSPTSPNAIGQTLSDVRISGLSGSVADQLKSRLPVQAGGVWTAAMASIVSQIVTGFDPSLELDLVTNPASRQWSLWIGPKVSRFVNQVPVSFPPPPAGVYQVSRADGVTPPTVLTKFDPAYTDAAKAAGVSGSVTLSMVVGADGTPQNIQVLGSLEPGLDQSALEALSKWRFRPGTKDGAPVSVQAQVNLSFRLL